MLAMPATAWLYQVVPASCADAPQCAASMLEYPQWYHGYIAMALGVLFLREASVLLVSVAEARTGSKQIWSMKEQCLPPALLCAILFTLGTVEAVLASSESHWFHVGMGRPVATVRYAEWLANVPLLLLLTGCGALGRPTAEVVGPILVTNAYIVASWAALLVDSAAVRWMLIAGTFAAFGWASHRMLWWTTDFLREAPQDVPCRYARVASVVLLVALFGIYGVIYLATIGGLMLATTELIAYSVLGFGCKVTMSLIFASIRAHQNQQALASLVGRIGGVSTAFVSLLRGSFDYVLPCLAGPDGTCRVPAQPSGDSGELERCLGRSVIGTNLNDHLANEQERKRFAVYVQNALRQGMVSSSPPPASHLARMSFAKDEMPPVAHLLHVRLRKAAACADEAPQREDTVSAMVHLSLVPSSLGPAEATGEQQAVIALQLASQEQDVRLQQLPQPSAEDVALDSDTSSGDQPPGKTSRFPTNDSGTTRETCGAGLAEMYWQAQCPSEAGSYLQSLQCASAEKQATRTAKLILRLLDKRVRPQHSQSKGARKGKGRARRRVANGSRQGQEAADSCSQLSGQKVSFRFGGSDVASQSSRLSVANSVVLACRQLLGPLHDELPPAQFISKRIEDHVQCSAEMARLKACTQITRHWHKQRLEDWEDRADMHSKSELLQKSAAPECETGLPEQVWRSQVLPHLDVPPPGPRPAAPDLPDDAELWHRAWKRTYESDASSDSESEGEPRIPFLAGGTRVEQRGFGA
eukprot:gb/GFBE01010555.1/.p1 GENE.gb/GFBE01010555.1/~~gb/GFBE01010555.1/.p1  ORF type:complete len:755 (+),score=108.56 gb/GFBE01010555.1/:1-2265(+)